MKKIATDFIKSNEKYRTLYLDFLHNNSEKSLKILNEEFYSYLFKIYLTSYIRKSITLTAYKLMKKYNLQKYREQLSLNVIKEGYEEENINLIADNDINFEEEIIRNQEVVNFNEVFSDERLTMAIDTLTKRQKHILYMRFVREIEEDEIARILNISKQSINKTKNTAIKKIESYMRSVNNGFIQ